ncbi:metallopeptidase TldD-related protein [bacterium]|nr:metallopeptidase TldD-related protein [bacterium]
MKNSANLNEANFYNFCEKIFSLLNEDENLSVFLEGETTNFCRLNNSRIRQVGDIEQFETTLTYTSAKKKMVVKSSYQNNLSADLSSFEKTLASLRKEITGMDEDPYFVAIKNNGTSSLELGEEINTDEILPKVLDPIQNIDLAGIWASGLVYRATANTMGERNWFKSASFYLDYSLYTKAQKAVKGLYAGSKFDSDEYLSKIEKAREELAIMELAPRKIEKGSYRTYLAPAAVAEIVSTLNWGALSYKSYKMGQNALKDLKDEKKSFSAKFNLKENFEIGLSAPFNSLGEVAPKSLNIIEAGKLENFLVSSRSAVEFELDSNGADSDESGRSLDLGAGSLEESEILDKIGTGLYINNLHYLNWSDMQNARITGMTRFACFWVENGKIVSPIEDLRFDDTLYNIFGKNLIDLTCERSVGPNLGSYENRNLGGERVPGVLLENFTFTL